MQDALKLQDTELRLVDTAGTIRVHRIMRNYALSLALWLPISQLIGWQTYIMDRREHVPVLLGPLLLAYGARGFTIAILSPPLFKIVERWPLTVSIVRRSAGYALGFVAFSCAFALIRWLLLPPWLEETLTWGPRSFATLLDLAYSTFADILLAYVGTVAVAHAYTYFVRGQRQEIERLALHQSLTQSELQVLRMQLHPHFLFNTLQGIAELIESDPPRAHAMLTTLASLLRTALRHGSADLVPFSEELGFIRAYVSLEQMRLGNRLRVCWQIESEALDILVPQLLLQPLVENAIRYGAASTLAGGTLELNVGVVNSHLHIQVTNSVADAAKCGHGVGLANTRARLQHLYSGDAKLQFSLNSIAKIAVVEITLPLFRSHAARQEAEVAYG